MKKLDNKVAVVTGGNSGIGLATARLFAQHGAKVLITGRNEQTIKDAVAGIGNGAKGIAADVAELKNIDTVYHKVNSDFGKIDVLVLNAGVFNGAPLADYTEEMFDHVVGVNLKGVFFSVQKALPFLNDGASIIITGSTVGDKGMAGLAAYSATKAAVRSLARGFSAELLSRKIRVNVLSPGPIDTPIFGRGGGTQEEVNASKAHFASAVPVKRMGTAEEMAAGFLYLASDDSQFMVGGELLLDGGIGTL